MTSRWPRNLGVGQKEAEQIWWTWWAGRQFEGNKDVAKPVEIAWALELFQVLEPRSPSSIDLESFGELVTSLSYCRRQPLKKPVATQSILLAANAAKVPLFTRGDVPELCVPRRMVDWLKMNLQNGFWRNGFWRNDALTVAMETYCVQCGVKNTDHAGDKCPFEPTMYVSCAEFLNSWMLAPRPVSAAQRRNLCASRE